MLPQKVLSVLPSRHRLLTPCNSFKLQGFHTDGLSERENQSSCLDYIHGSYKNFSVREHSMWSQLHPPAFSPLLRDLAFLSCNYLVELSMCISSAMENSS